MDTTKIKMLIEKFRQGTLSEEECMAFSVLLQDQKQREKVESVMDTLLQLPLSSVNDEENKDLIYQQILFSISSKTLSKNQSKKSIIIHIWKKAAAAAAVIILLFSSLYVYRMVVNPSQKIVRTKDVAAPSKSIATIQLLNGKIIQMENMNSSPISLQENVTVTKDKNNQLVYTLLDHNLTGMQKNNTLVNPSGSKILKVILSDGSKVWLNAGSSINFPIAFTGFERKLSMTGEAYFEIAHDSHKPFLVQANGSVIKVLGTHFNVNAFSENNVTSTLIEGKVEVNVGNIKRMISPGQSAISSVINKNLVIVENIDTTSIISWTREKFSFNNMTATNIMEQLKRWYGVDVIYEAGYDKTTQYFGETPMNQNLSEVLKVLALAGLNCQLKDKCIVVRGQ